MPVKTRPYCVYCGATADLILSALIPDGTLYPGVQRMCADDQACHLRIHVKYHAEVRAPECGYCDMDALSGRGPDHA